MFKIYNKILFFLVCFLTNQAFGLNSSSYLISNTAINLFDFDKAQSQFLFSDEQLGESDLHNKLLILVNLNLISDAQRVAKEILKLNKYNQESWIVYLADAKLKNNSEPFDEYKNQKDTLNMNLLEYIFYNKKNEVKENKMIARSIFEVVKGSLADETDQINYKFLLFYLSIANFIDENFYEGYFLTAQIYQRLENYSKAEFFYKKIKSSDKLFLNSQINIANNKNKLGLFNEAEQSLIELKNTYTNNIVLLIALADFYRVEIKYVKAIQYYSNVLNLKSNLPDVSSRTLYMRGICFERLQKWDLAEQDFLDSLEIKPDSPQVLNYLAYGWLERDKNIDLAMNMLNKAYKANPSSYYILDSLAWAYFKKNQLIKAAELMEKVITMAPGEAISLDHLADIYFALNRKREAIYYWGQALELAEPEDMIIDDLKRKLEVYYAG